VYSLKDYDFPLPPELIAQHPAEPRDASRLLVVDRRAGRWEHRTFRDLPEYFGAPDVLVANNTRVIPARLLGRRLLSDGSEGERLGGKVEFLLLEELGPCVWEGMFHAAAKHKPGIRFRIPTPDGRSLVGELIRGASASPHGTVVARFDRDPVESGAGQLPLPPYIERTPDAADAERYQTVYASRPGSAAAPTAGLHFTPRVREELRARGAGWEEVTLSVGLGTFRPVKAADIREHAMHDERYEIDAETARRLTEAKRAGRRITAVGTTAVRTLESAWRGGALHAGAARTSIFIYPGYEWRCVDRLLTNFHLPQSTLLMLVSAFAGRELVLAAYAEAVRQRYRFFSYGDAMLLL
jgi:S-adenosylmethionine:tRNA ribosyltransferase-isomerase